MRVLLLAVLLFVPRLQAQESESAQPLTPRTIAEADAARAAGNNDLYESALQLLAQSEDPDVRRAANARLGVLYANQDRHDEAARFLTAAAADNSPLQPFLLLELMKVHEKRGTPAEAASVAQRIIRDHSSGAAARMARLRLPAIRAAAKEREGAAAAVAATASMSLDELAETELVTAAAALDRAGWQDLATPIRMRLLTEMPSGRYTETTYEHLSTMQDSPLARLSFDEMVALADRLSRVNRFPQALDLLQRARTRFPTRSTAPLLQYTRLRSLFNSRQYQDVIRAPKLRPRDDHYLAAEMLRARAHWRLDQNDEFLAIVNGILKSHPRSAAAHEGRIQLSRFYTIDQKDYDRAARYLGEAISSSGAGDQGEHLWNLGWIYTLAGQDHKALDTFARYVAQFPDSDYTTNSLFWTGKIHDRLGNTEGRDAAFNRLTGTFPYAYYSYRAREILGLAQPPAAQQSNGITFPALSAQSDSRLALVRELQALGLSDSAAAQMKIVAGDAPSDPVLSFAMAEMYVEAGQPLRAIGILNRSFRDVIRRGASNVPARFWEILYPRLYWPEISAAAQQSGLDPYFISSLIRQESGFDPRVVSSAGAVGLMQIMPNEASSIAADARLTGGIRRSDLFDPRLNVTLGSTEYLQKLQAMNGNPILAIASYNAGETAVSGWLSRIPATDVDFFIESIPFNETRLYVKNVIRNHHEYRRIYANGNAG